SANPSHQSAARRHVSAAAAASPACSRKARSANVRYSRSPMLSLLPPGRQDPQEGFLDGVLLQRTTDNSDSISPAITSTRVFGGARRVCSEPRIVHHVVAISRGHIPAI